jgi:hypothetical protein
VQPATYPLTAGSAFGALYFNPDIKASGDSGMGHSHNRAAKIIEKWNLTAGDGCPSSVSSINPAATCASRTVGEGANRREAFSITTAVGHGDSVEPMTKMMFKAFYR